MENNTSSNIVVEDTNSFISNTPNTPKIPNHKKTKIIIVVGAVIVIVLSYFFFKNKDPQQKYEAHTVTNEDRLNMLQKLDVTPEDQKKNELSPEGKNKFADSIPDAGVYKKSNTKSKEEIANILNATN